MKCTLKIRRRLKLSSNKNWNCAVAFLWLDVRSTIRLPFLSIHTLVPLGSKLEVGDFVHPLVLTQCPISTQGPFWYLALHHKFSTTLFGSLPCKEIAPVTHVVNEVVSKLPTPSAIISPVRNKNKSDFRDWETVRKDPNYLDRWVNSYGVIPYRCWLGIQACSLPAQ